MKTARTRRSSYAAAVSAIACAAALASASPAAAPTRSWDFRVALDGKEIGSHRFALRNEAAERELRIVARFDVKLLGFSAYRYSHEATERWRGDCLASLAARTDDNGDISAVAAERSGDRMTVSGPLARPAIEGCVMSFAYWNPAILQAHRLLNSQTGAYEAVSVARIGEETLSVRGAPVAATHYRITGSKHPIDLWYSQTGDWLALESVVDKGRRLSYRLQ